MKMHYVTTVLLNNELRVLRGTWVFQTSPPLSSSLLGAREGTGEVGGLACEG